MSYLLHTLVEESAKRSPEKTAVCHEGQEISYAQLDELSEHICASLIQNGLLQGSRVGLYAGKSIESIGAILGILKAGSSYVPIDPLFPPSRIAAIINDCSLQYLITSKSKLPQISRFLEFTDSLRYIIILDSSERGSTASNERIHIVLKHEILHSDITVNAGRKKGITDSALAYILYTSGSTGKPKGVMISHKAALAFVDWAFNYFKVKQGDEVSSHAPFHFDLSIFDIFVTLKAGATIHIVPQGFSSFPLSLADFIENQKISIWYSVPSILIQLLLHGQLTQRDFSALRLILFAGEVFPVSYLKELMRLIPKPHYYNLYGPTETNVCTYYGVSGSINSDTPLPIGVACAGTELFIAGEDGRMRGEGELGELYVSGPTLMEGYWNDSAHTDSVLLNDFPRRGKKAYKTSDFVIRRQDGNLEYHGRRDTMIKSRGYRIELGEIESTLLLNSKIKEAAVVGVSDKEIGRRIKAFLVIKEKCFLPEEEIKKFCMERLPAYMIPELFIFKKALPKTSTGKTDRKELEIGGV